MTEVYNKDVVFLNDMLDRYIAEIGGSQSTGISGVLPFDVERILSYTAAVKRFMAWANSQPILDLPESHPRLYTLEPFSEPQNVESESVNMLVRLFQDLRTEVVNSQSTRLSGTLLPADTKRIENNITKIESFVNEYVSDATPLDLPESSPEEPMVGHGRRGSNPS